MAEFSRQRPAAIRRYKPFVTEGMGVESIWADLKRQIFLGEEPFVARMQAMNKGLSNRVWAPKAQARLPASTNVGGAGIKK